MALPTTGAPVTQAAGDLAARIKSVDVRAGMVEVTYPLPKTQTPGATQVAGDAAAHLTPTDVVAGKVAAPNGRITTSQGVVIDNVGSPG
jgi:hypothetical protein